MSDFQHIDKSWGYSDILSELALRIVIFLFIFPLSSMKTNEQIVIWGSFFLESLHFFDKVISNSRDMLLIFIRVNRFIEQDSGKFSSDGLNFTFISYHQVLPLGYVFTVNIFFCNWKTIADLKQGRPVRVPEMIIATADAWLMAPLFNLINLILGSMG